MPISLQAEVMKAIATGKQVPVALLTVNRPYQDRPNLEISGEVIQDMFDGKFLLYLNGDLFHAKLIDALKDAQGALAWRGGCTAKRRDQAINAITAALTAAGV